MPDLPIGSTDWSLGPPAKVYIVYYIFNTVIGLSHLCCHDVMYFLNNPSVIFLTQLHSISEYCRILNTPHHLRLYSNWLNTHLPPVVIVGNWEGPHKWNSLGPALDITEILVNVVWNTITLTSVYTVCTCFEHTFKILQMQSSRNSSVLSDITISKIWEDFAKNCQKLVFCNRKLMSTDIFFSRTTKPICNFVNPGNISDTTTHIEVI